MISRLREEETYPEIISIVIFWGRILKVYFIWHSIDVDIWRIKDLAWY